MRHIGVVLVIGFVVALTVLAVGLGNRYPGVSIVPGGRPAWESYPGQVLVVEWSPALPLVGNEFIRLPANHVAVGNGWVELPPGPPEDPVLIIFGENDSGTRIALVTAQQRVPVGIGQAKDGFFLQPQPSLLRIEPWYQPSCAVDANGETWQTPFDTAVGVGGTLSLSFNGADPSGKPSDSCPSASMVITDVAMLDVRRRT